MIRTYLATAATALVLGIGMLAGWSVAAPSEASAQGWRDHDRRYGYDRRYERRVQRDRGYRQQRPAYGRSYNVPAGPGGLGRAGVLPNGRTFYTPPGRELPGGQTYETSPRGQGTGGAN